MTSFDRDKHKTHTAYWKFENPGIKEAKKVLQAVPFAKSITEAVLNRKIATGAPAGADMARRSFPIDPRILEYRAQRLTETISAFLRSLGLSRSNEQVRDDIERYDLLFHDSPFHELGGGMGYNNGLVLFCFTASVNAAQIIESGVWKGFTTYILDHASSANSKMFCFDINLSKIEWRSAKAEYFEHDINEWTANVDGESVLSLYDDHVSQYDRLQYSYDRGFKYLVFDDDVTHLNVHSDGWPPVPTLSMIWNKDELPTKFQWMRGSTIATADFSNLECAHLIDAYIYVTPPDLFELTGYRETSRTSYLVRR